MPSCILPALGLVRNPRPTLRLPEGSEVSTSRALRAQSAAWVADSIVATDSEAPPRSPAPQQCKPYVNQPRNEHHRSRPSWPQVGDYLPEANSYYAEKKERQNIDSPCQNE